MKTIKHIVFSLFTIALIGCASTESTSAESTSTVPEEKAEVVSEESTEPKENYGEGGTLIDRYISGEISSQKD